MTVTLQRLGIVCGLTAKCSQKRLNFFSMMISTRGLRGKDEGVKAGLVDDHRLLVSSDGVTNRYPIPLVLIVNVV